MNYLKNIYKSNLFKISSLNTVSVGVRIAGGLLASKMIAAFIGPGGIAIIGDFRNFLTSLETYATLGLQNGIVKYVAENNNDEKKLNKVVTTIFITVTTAIILFSITIFLCSDLINKFLFTGTHHYSSVFKITAISLPWFAGNVILMAIVNGLGKYREIIKINIAGNILGVLLSAILIWQYGTTGAMLGLIITPAFIFVFCCYLLKHQFLLSGFSRLVNFDGSIFKGLLSYSAMALFSALAGPWVAILVRSTITNSCGITEAGFWEAMVRLSSFYLMFITTLLSVYFFPKLAQSKNNYETKGIIRNYYKIMLPVFICGAVIMYFLRNLIIRIVYSYEFLPMQNLFFWQLLGDFFKVCYLVLGYVLVAKKLLKQFILIEAASYALLYILSILFIEIHGTLGAIIAQAVVNIIMFISMLLYFRSNLR